MSALVTLEWNTDQVATVTFNRPEAMNALDVAVARAFRSVVEEVVAAGTARAIVLAGAGKAFLAGGDVAAFHASRDNAGPVLDAILDEMHPAIIALHEQDAPIIARVQGAAAGAGLSLVLLADIVIAAENAKFLLAYDKLGASPDCGATWALSQRIGRGRALELMFLSRTLSADEAQALGIVTEVASNEDLDDHVAAVASRLAAGPTQAFGAFRRLIDMRNGLARQLEEERESFLCLTRTDAFKEGIDAFVERRKPDFRSCDG